LLLVPSGSAVRAGRDERGPVPTRALSRHIGSFFRPPRTSTAMMRSPVRLWTRLGKSEACRQNCGDHRGGERHRKSGGDTLVWIRASAFAPNAAGTYGNAGYNSLIARGYFDIDTNLTKYFPIRERQRFELRFEFFNALNHTNFNAPVNRLSSATFGVIQSSLDPRILQFAAKYSF
jgi:hypothetical protein